MVEIKFSPEARHLFIYEKEEIGLFFVWPKVADGGSFALGEKFNAVADLCFILTAQQRAFGAAKWQIRHGRRHAYVDTQHTGVGVPQEILSNDSGFGKDTAAVAVFGIVDNINAFLIGFCFD